MASFNLVVRAVVFLLLLVLHSSHQDGSSKRQSDADSVCSKCPEVLTTGSVSSVSPHYDFTLADVEARLLVGPTFRNNNTNGATNATRSYKTSRSIEESEMLAYVSGPKLPSTTRKMLIRVPQIQAGQVTGRLTKLYSSWELGQEKKSIATLNQEFKCPAEPRTLTTCQVVFSYVVVKVPVVFSMKIKPSDCTCKITGYYQKTTFKKAELKITVEYQRTTTVAPSTTQNPYSTTLTSTKRLLTSPERSSTTPKRTTVNVMHITDISTHTPMPEQNNTTLHAVLIVLFCVVFMILVFIFYKKRRNNPPINFPIDLPMLQLQAYGSIAPSYEKFNNDEGSRNSAITNSFRDEDNNPSTSSTDDNTEHNQDNTKPEGDNKHSILQGSILWYKKRFGM